MSEKKVKKIKKAATKVIGQPPAKRVFHALVRAYRGLPAREKSVFTGREIFSRVKAASSHSFSNYFHRLNEEQREEFMKNVRPG